MRRLLVATTNRHKTCEIAQMLERECEVVDLSLHPAAPIVAEMGATFAENAILKATAVSSWCGGLVLADDSGLEVDLLGGAPGVRSARFAGDGATDEANRAALLKALARARAGEAQTPTARFRCVLILAESGSVLASAEGAVEGTITDAPAGEGGFGYDPIFIPEGYAQTFAELPAEVKNRYSHRARALTVLLPVLREILAR